MVTVRIPGPMRSLTGGASSVAVEGATVREVLEALVALHPQARPRIFDDQGRLRRFVNLYVGEEDVRFADGLETGVEAGQAVSILPAVAGGGRP